MKNPLTLVKTLIGPHTTIGDLHADDLALREALATAETERGRLLSAPPPKPEVLQALDTELEQLATEWRAARGLAVGSALSGVCEVSATGALRILRYANLAEAVGPLSLAALAALAPALVREGLRALIARTPWDDGAPMAQRAALLAEADRTIAALVTKHADLVKDAGALKVALEDLPVTVGRRIQAEQARARWELDGRVNAGYYRKNPSARPPEPEGAP